MHKVGDLLKVRNDNTPFIQLTEEEYSGNTRLGVTYFSKNDHFRISRIHNEHIYMRIYGGDIYYIKDKDIDDFLINVRSLRKNKLDNIFKK